MPKGRPPSAKTLVDRQLGRNIKNPVLPAGDSFIIPNYSGVGNELKEGLATNLGTKGSILFINATGNITEDNSNLFWDDTNNRLGVGTKLPDGRVHIFEGTAGAVTANSAADGLIIEDNTDTGLSIITPDGKFSNIFLGAASSNAGSIIRWKHSTKILQMGTNFSAGSFQLLTDAGTLALDIDSSQNFNFQDGNLTTTGTGDFQGSLNLQTTTITNDTTLGTAHNIVLCNNTSNKTITLPAASATDRTYYIKKINSGTALVTIDGNSAETIDGELTIVLYIQYDAIRIVSDGSNWHIISEERIAHKARMSRDAAQTITTSTFTKIAFDNIVYNDGGMADATTNDRFDIKRAGKYLISTFWGTNANIDDGEFAEVDIYLNGSSIASNLSYSPALNKVIVAAFSDVFDLAVDDFIEMFVIHDEGGNIDTRTDRVKPQMTVVEIRP